MARMCSVCGKRPVKGYRVSHAHNKTKRIWRPNVQKVRLVVDGKVRRMNVCTRCLRSGKVSKAA